MANAIKQIAGLSNMLTSIITNNAADTFPVNPLTGQKCYRTDLKKTYQYNGTTWESNDLSIWQSDGNYEINDRVIYNSQIWQSLTSHEENGTFNTTQWQVIGTEVTGGNMPAGIILPFSGNGDIPTGYLLCDGSSVLRETYPDLYAAIGTTYGSVDDTHFNLPDLTDKFIEGSTTAGTEKSAGLPNITGAFRAGVNTESDFTGAFSQTSTFTGFTATTQTSFAKADFDASRSNSIYGNSDTVQPPALTMRYIIKAFDGQTSDSALIDITQYANELNLKVNKAEADYVTESYTDDDGNWYRVYKSGWVEQGGFCKTDTVGVKTITLHKPMANTLYTAIRANGNGCTVLSEYAYTVRFYSFIITSTTTIQTYSNNENTIDHFAWYVFGQGASE